MNVTVVWLDVPGYNMSVRVKVKIVPPKNSPACENFYFHSDQRVSQDLGFWNLAALS